MPKNAEVKKIVNSILVGAYVLGLLVLATFLFFGDQLGAIFNFNSSNQLMHGSSQELIIGYASQPVTLDPIQFDAVSRSRLVDVYEGLVRTDRNLKIEPALAVSWGLIDPLTWEFRLRPNVQFHDGKSLLAEDVVASLERAKSDTNSQLRTFLSSVDKIEIVAEDKIRIQTTVPDPLLLNKLAVTFISPKHYVDFARPLGTGPYYFVSNLNGEIKLGKFDNYWGQRPKYDRVILRTIEDRDERIAQLENNQIQLVVDLPAFAACSEFGKYADKGCNIIKNPDVIIKSIPSLEVSFVIFNFSNSVFENVDYRRAIAKAIDPQFFVDLAYGYAHQVGQFVSSGVFGFNSGIPKSSYDLEDAKKSFQNLMAENFDRLNVTFDYPDSLDSVAQYFKDQFAQLGIDLILNPLSESDLRTKIFNGQSEMYFLGWRSELGDAIDFLTEVAHGRDDEKGFGRFNNTQFHNPLVDELIEKSQINLDPVSRLKDLQEVMKMVVTDNVIGLPLFESEIIYAYNKNLVFDPRVDGYVYASEIN